MLRRATLVREAPRVPDLTAQIFAEVPAPRPQRWGLRLALAVVALVQSGLGLAELLGADVGHAAHDGLAVAVYLGNESAAWNVAIGLGLLWAALRPSAATGLLAAFTGFVVVLGIASGVDLSAGQVSVARVLSHGVVVIGVVLLYAVWHQHKRHPAPLTAGRQPVPGSAATGRSEVADAAPSTGLLRRRSSHPPTGSSGRKVA